MDAKNGAPHSYYPEPDVWQTRDLQAERVRHDEWEKSDPNMVAIAEMMSASMKDEGESFATYWGAMNY